MEALRLDHCAIMEAILTALSPVMGWIVMKKDSELPWAVRIARWFVTACGSAWLIGYVVHSYIEWFL